MWHGKSLLESNRNHDIFFIVSRDGGASFSSLINLSNNTGFSEHPQISASGNNVYIIWVDDNNTRNKQVLLRKAYDSGSTFEPVSQLSKDGVILLMQR